MPMNDDVTMLMSRLQISRLMTALVKSWRSTLQDLVAPKDFKADAGDIHILCAVVGVQLEGRGVTAGQVARALDVPYTTVVTKLKRLQKVGLVEVDGAPVKRYVQGTQFCIPSDVLEAPEVLENVGRSIRLILTASQHITREVSELGERPQTYPMLMRQ